MIKFTGDTFEVLEGAKILFADRTEDLTVNIKKEGIGLKIDKVGDDITICYSKKCEFFRAMVLLLEDYRDCDEIHIHQTPKFKTIGLMPQSVGGSITVDAIKEILRYMAKMGMNFIMIYTEELYEVDGLPYHGYMRGRYTQAQLRECDEYADIFGIEMIPCIQTLAHLTSALRWEYTREFKDTANVLLVGEEKTYEFLRKTIRAAAAPYKSKRIHLGLDEAFDLGFGKYLRENGYEPQIDIFIKHLKRLVEIVKEEGLEPMMWSDMYLSTSSPIGDMYDRDLVIPQEIVDAAPPEIDLVYWDYYNCDEDAYRHALDQHARFKAKTIFAGGIWLWNGFVPNMHKTMITTKPALKVCREKGIDEVIATIWGVSPSIYTILPGMQMYAEYGYQDEVTDDLIKARFRACTNEDFDAFEAISKLDYIADPVAQNWFNPSDPASFLLWQNVMMGLFDKHIEGKNTQEYYGKLAIELDELSKKTQFKITFDYYKEYAHTLSLKADIGVRLKAAYDAGDKAELKKLADSVLPEIENRIKSLRMAHMKMWYETRMPFGWEKLDMIYGSLTFSTDTAIQRVNAYLNGEIDRLEEFEEERLYYGTVPEGKDGLSWHERSFMHAYSAN